MSDCCQVHVHCCQDLWKVLDRKSKTLGLSRNAAIVQALLEWAQKH